MTVELPTKREEVNEALKAAFYSNKDDFRVTFFPNGDTFYAVLDARFVRMLTSATMDHVVDQEEMYEKNAIVVVCTTTFLGLSRVYSVTYTTDLIKENYVDLSSLEDVVDVVFEFLSDFDDRCLTRT